MSNETVEERVNNGLKWAKQRVEVINGQIKELEPKVKRNKFESRTFLGLGFGFWVVGVFWKTPVLFVALACYGLSIIWDFRGMDDSVTYKVLNHERDSFRLAFLISGVIVGGGDPDETK